jgi:hypothetical protein
VARGSRIGTAIAIAVSLCACRPRETPEVARERTVETALLAQIEDLKALAKRAEAGEISTLDRVVIGISEDLSKALLDASLPQEQVLGDRVRVRIEKVQPFFQGNNAALLFEAVAEGLTSGASARLELAGQLVNFRILEGRLKADIELIHFKLIDSSLPDLGAGILERLIQDHLGALAGLAPKFEIPVRLEQAIKIGGLDEGVVQARGGVLPLSMSVAEVAPVNHRLWVFLDVKGGPWKSAAKAAQK